jgi:magnesium-protoporphyrin O-methyltransferase
MKTRFQSFSLSYSTCTTYAAAPKFDALGLEECSGKYNLVTCIDVMIHYPTDRVNDMISHLASLSDDKLIISFAPKTTAYTILKRFGELFPGPSKATRAYLHAEADVEAALKVGGCTTWNPVDPSRLKGAWFQPSNL